MTRTSDFYEDDEPFENVARAFETGTWVTTWSPLKPAVPHSDNVTITWTTPWGSSDD